MLEVLFAAAGAAVSSAWHLVTHRNHEIRNHREMCNHQWGEAFEVCRHPLGLPPHFYKQFCKACSAQRNVNEDGTPYVPATERRDEHPDDPS